MEWMLRLVGIAMGSMVLISFLRPLSPALSVMLSLACTAVMLFVILGAVGEVFAALSGMLASAGLDGTLYFPILKAVGISVLVRITSSLCRDCGQSALGTKLELAGAAASVAVCVPLVEQVFSLLGMLMK